MDTNRNNNENRHDQDEEKSGMGRKMSIVNLLVRGIHVCPGHGACSDGSPGVLVFEVCALQETWGLFQNKWDVPYDPNFLIRKKLTTVSDARSFTGEPKVVSIDFVSFKFSGEPP